MNPIISIYKLMGINVSMNLSNADEESSQSIRDRQSTMDRQSIMDSLNLISSKIIVLEEDKIRSDGKISELDSKIIVLEEDKIRSDGKILELGSKIIVLEEDKIRLNGKILELDSKIIVLEEDKTSLNGKVSFLEKECLHSKLENNAIQLLKYGKLIDAVRVMIENNNVFITLSDIQLTMTEFKVRYEALRDNRNDETHPFGNNNYKPENLVDKSINLIKEMDFSTVDKNSQVYFAKLVIENYSAVTDSLIDSTNKYQKK